MIAIREGRLSFVFSNGVTAVKFDTWPPYLAWRGGGKSRKGVDVVCNEPGRMWLLEVKDFRVQTGAPRVANSSRLPKTVDAKVRGTLAGLAAMAESGNAFAAGALAAGRRRVVLHLEPPVHGQRLFPSLTQAANIHNNLRKLVRDIDPEPMVLRSSTTAGAQVPWSVS